MPRPRSLTPQGIAAAALAVLDRDGTGGLTMRAVAQELGVSTMGLYRYVADREELEGLVVELVLGAVDPVPPADGSWQERIAVLVERVRVAVGAHPAVVPLTMTHRHRSPAILRWSESVAGLLTEAGTGPRQRAVALRGLLAYVIGAIQLEHLGPLAGPGTVAIAGLDPAEFPHMRATAREAQGVPADEEFRGGLAMLLAGIRA
ncbi:TetR/AcrR family transcriptional regulator [Dactylosporangium sp. AC04546]|uniref:TetR/AcrR family transcriptional regulator n=1 Tax=Dactylosporangium sp. AC04546 TaxID=2862460 RepID=UPI001EDF8AF4|nr:TetR/AcrR family transcriptional regulator [Dactylosporangium sp. AC04546]WVK83305.1 TetR/AcrR family transcriptional regulator [Dactylosporangium sp. AC04546]